MAKTIKLPGIGPVKSTYVYAGLGITAGILAVAYWRRSQAPPAEDAAVVGSSEDLATDPYAQYSDAAGYNTVYPPQGGYAPYGYDLYGNPIPPPVSSGSGGPYTTNRDWAAAATETLVDGGMTSDVASTAVSAVLGGLSVTAAQRDMFLRAVGVLGEPPQGYEKPIHVIDTPAQPSGPHPVLPAPATVRVVSTGRTGVKLDWSDVPGTKKGYAMYRNGARVTSVVYSLGQFSNLKPNTSYKFEIATINPDNKEGGRRAITVRTKK